MFEPSPEQELIRPTESSVEPLDGLRPSGGGRCPARVAPRAGAFGPRGPLKARAGALAEAA